MGLPGPPNYHLLVEEDETLSLSVEERVNYARLSIDVLFESAAAATRVDHVLALEEIGPFLVKVTGGNDA